MREKIFLSLAEKVADVHVKDADGHSLLYWAIKFSIRHQFHGCLIVEALLRQGIDVNYDTIKDGAEDQSLLWYALSWGSIQVAKQLINAGANVHWQNHERRSLVELVAYCWMQMVPFLIP